MLPRWSINVSLQELSIHRKSMMGGCRNTSNKGEQCWKKSKLMINSNEQISHWWKSFGDSVSKREWVQKRKSKLNIQTFVYSKSENVSFKKINHWGPRCQNYLQIQMSVLSTGQTLPSCLKVMALRWKQLQA